MKYYGNSTNISALKYTTLIPCHVFLWIWCLEMCSMWCWNSPISLVPVEEADSIPTTPHLGGQECSYCSLMHLLPLPSLPPSYPSPSLLCPSFPLSPCHHSIPFPLFLSFFPPSLSPSFLSNSHTPVLQLCTHSPLRTASFPLSSKQPNIEMQNLFNNDSTFHFALCGVFCLFMSVYICVFFACTPNDAPQIPSIIRECTPVI